MFKFKTKTKIVRDFVNSFPTNFLKFTTFLHPMGVLADFYRTDCDPS